MNQSTRDTYNYFWPHISSRSSSCFCEVCKTFRGIRSFEHWENICRCVRQPAPALTRKSETEIPRYISFFEQVEFHSFSLSLSLSLSILKLSMSVCVSLPILQLTLSVCRSICKLYQSLDLFLCT